MKKEDNSTQEVTYTVRVEKNVGDNVSKNAEFCNSDSLDNKLKKKIKELVWVFDVVGTLVALFAAFISLVTLFEMQEQRNNAYMPTIVFESIEVETELEDSEIKDIYDGIRFTTRNIGVGVAKKITFEVDSSNYIRWIELYNELNPEHPYFYEISNNRLNVSRDGKAIGFSANYKNEKLFLLPNAEESYEFELPGQYKMLLHEIYTYSNEWMIEIPDIVIEVSYFDVQNVPYREKINLSVETMLFIHDENEKYVIYQINMD